MRIAVYGLGYVGCVSAAAFARLGHDVVGVDSNPDKVQMLLEGRTPVLEPGLPDLVQEQVARGALRATVDGEAPMATVDVALICVGTPSRSNGSLATDALERVAASIGRGLRERTSPQTPVVVVRSTSIPGTTEEVVGRIVAETSGLEAGAGFGLAMNPEFLREGSSLADFDSPPKTVIGQLDEASGDAVAALYDGLSAPVHRVPIRVAEMVKYADNAFHATKIAFANEVGTACQALGVDAREVMRIFCTDVKLNISEAYLKPGFAFGGSCLPKDLRALVHAARRVDLELPLLESILPANERHLRRAVDLVLAAGGRRIALFGLSFKPGTDDLRESPLVELAERLLGKGYELRIHDSAVALSALVGANRAYVEEHIPHLSRLLVPSPEEALEGADVCVVGARTPEIDAALAAADAIRIVDLVGLPDAGNRARRGGYDGIVW
jgi:GDP-mannose 6-dehydrogenase